MLSLFKKFKLKHATICLGVPCSAAASGDVITGPPYPWSVHRKIELIELSDSPRRLTADVTDTHDQY